MEIKSLTEEEVNEISEIEQSPIKESRSTELINAEASMIMQLAYNDNKEAFENQVRKLAEAKDFDTLNAVRYLYVCSANRQKWIGIILRTLPA